MEINTLATEAFTCVFYQMHPIAHAGLEIEATRGCIFNHFFKSAQRKLQIQMKFVLVQRSYFVDTSEFSHPEMVKSLSLIYFLKLFLNSINLNVG